MKNKTKMVLFLFNDLVVITKSKEQPNTTKDLPVVVKVKFRKALDLRYLTVVVAPFMHPSMLLFLSCT